MTPETCDIFIERKASSGLRPCPHDEDADLGRQLTNRNYHIVVEARCIL
jgi:hypothetical protein